MPRPRPRAGRGKASTGSPSGSAWRRSKTRAGCARLAIALGYAPGEWPESASLDWRLWRPIKVPREARDLVDMARREGVPWQTAQRLALAAGLKTIEARGGLTETRRQVEAGRRGVVTQAWGAPRAA
jgi:hypothetical protein